MRFYFHEDAEEEFDRAVEYYEDYQPGLGLEFAQEVYATITRVIQFPDVWSPMSKNTRRCLVSRFPFRRRGTLFNNLINIISILILILYIICQEQRDRMPQEFYTM